MAQEWYLMTRPLFNGGDEKEEFENYAEDGFSELLESFISSDVYIYETNNFDVRSPIKAIVQNVTSDSEYTSFFRQILTPIGTLETGYFVNYKDKYWLVKDMVDNNKIYEKAIIVYCNYNINFISDISGNVTTYPVHMKNATQYNSGETPREQATVGSSKFLIYIPYNSETIKIDHGKRFLIDRNEENPTAFEITQVDTVSHNFKDYLGVLRWTVVESQFNSKTDNKELMVADYFPNSSNESWI